MCQFLPGLLFGTLLLCTVYAVPLLDESVADNTDDDADIDVLVRRLEKVLTDQLARKHEEQRQSLKRKIMRQIEELDSDDAGRLYELLSQRRMAPVNKRNNWFCLWCEIGERLAGIITDFCKNQTMCLDEFEEVMEAKATHKG